MPGLGLKGVGFLDQALFICSGSRILVQSGVEPGTILEGSGC